MWSVLTFTIVSSKWDHTLDLYKENSVSPFDKDVWFIIGSSIPGITQVDFAVSVNLCKMITYLLFSL